MSDLWERLKYLIMLFSKHFDMPNDMKRYTNYSHSLFNLLFSSRLLSQITHFFHSNRIWRRIFRLWCICTSSPFSENSTSLLKTFVAKKLYLLVYITLPTFSLLFSGVTLLINVKERIPNSVFYASIRLI